MIKHYFQEMWEAFLMAFGIDDSADYECASRTETIESACQEMAKK